MTNGDCITHAWEAIKKYANGITCEHCTVCGIARIRK